MGPATRRRRRRSGDNRIKLTAAIVAGALAVAGIVAAAGHFPSARNSLPARNAAAGTPAVNANCTLIVPANPLTARGLATPYQLAATNPADGPCDEANAGQTAFVQGAVLNPRTGQISVYDPVVVDRGARPAAAPVVPALPSGAVVAVWFGFNGGTLTLAGADQPPPAAAGTSSPSPASPSPGATASPASPSPSSPAPAATPSGSPAPSASPSSAPASTTPGGAPQPSPTATAPTPVASAAGVSAAAVSAAGHAPGGVALASFTRLVRPGASANAPASSGTADPILQQAGCVAGEDIGGQFSPFTQAGACNAAAFFRGANAAIAAGRLRVPSPGTGTDGMPCLTTRSFGLIDQDQSDNVTTQYLVSGGGQVAQDTAASRQALAGAATLFNGSDNGLLDLFVDPALGCAPWKAPDLADNGAPAPALPLDELQAAAYAGRVRGGGPAALVPLNDPMTLDGNGNVSPDKTNAYRAIVDMPPLPAGQGPGQYCTDMERIQGTRLQRDATLLRAGPSPMPNAADSLFTFLAMRLQQSFTNLNCGNFGLTNQVSTTANADGVVVGAHFAHQVAPVSRRHR